MTKGVLDASAILAFLRRERGWERVAPHVNGGLLSTVNLTEVVQKSQSIGINSQVTIAVLSELGVELVDFDREQAVLVASVEPATRPLGLSLADRACLALAIQRQRLAVTADRPWRDVECGVEVLLIR